MSRSAAQCYYVVLCEDLQAWTFVYAALIRSGASGRRISPRRYSDSRFHAGGGSGPPPPDGYRVYACGSQHVRENFPPELRLARSLRARNFALVVHIDVDNTTASGRSVANRVRELAAACEKASVPPRTDDDPVALLVCRRNIETWIHALDGELVNEHDEYVKLTGHESEAKPAAKKFADHARDRTHPDPSVPSLLTGLREFQGVI